MGEKRVLLVDDSKVSRSVIGQMVEALGHKVIGEAVNGLDGFEKYQALRPDVVLSDIEMPVLDGYGGLQKIMEYDPEAWVVMITTVVNAQMINKILALGAQDVLKKPLKIEKLREKFDLLE
jgi:two-component system chemotaxis response regulator CheY